MTGVLVRTAVATCCGGHRPAGECCWKCPTCASHVAAGLDGLCRATTAAVGVLALEYPSVHGVIEMAPVADLDDRPMVWRHADPWTAGIAMGLSHHSYGTGEGL